CRRQALLRYRRIVVAMNEIMGDARMIRMPGELRLEDCRRLQRPGVALVGRRLAGGEVERTEDLGFVVVAVALRQGLEGVGEGLDARALQALGEMIVIGGDSLDIGAFALGLGADRAAALDGLKRAPGILRARAGGGESVAMRIAAIPQVAM